MSSPSTSDGVSSPSNRKGLLSYLASRLFSQISESVQLPSTFEGIFALVAQSVEHVAVNHGVPSSSLGKGAKEG